MNIQKYKHEVVFYKDVLEHYIRYGRKYEPKRINISGKIPKIIHYCWFGRGEMSELIKRCMASWQRVLPDYKIIIWNEDNFPFEDYPFAKAALLDRKWAFVSDVARLHALYYYGGIYMDTDMEVLKPLDQFLNHEFFSSFESKIHIPTGLMGAKKESEYIRLLLEWYINKEYGKAYYQTANTKIITKLTCLYCGLQRNGCYQNLNDIVYYPREYFCPEKNNDGWKITDKTCAIHHFTGSW